MKVVADASILIALGGLGRLSLLEERFPQGVLVPPSVWREVVEQGHGRPGADAVAHAGWIRVKSIRDTAFVRLLQVTLDEGEAEAICLAREQKADVVLLDEKDARFVALQVGLPVLGTVGMLVWARRTGRLADLSAVLSSLQGSAGFRLSERLVAEALKQAGER